MSILASTEGELYVVASPSWQSEGGDDPRDDPGDNPGDDRGEDSGEDPDTSWGQDPVEGEGGDVEVGFRLSGGGLEPGSDELDMHSIKLLGAGAFPEQGQTTNNDKLQTTTNYKQ